MDSILTSRYTPNLKKGREAAVEVVADQGSNISKEDEIVLFESPNSGLQNLLHRIKIIHVLYVYTDSKETHFD